MSTPFAIRLAAHHVNRDGVIVYPTETVYGLGCDPRCEEAVNRINHIKQRLIDPKLLLVASDFDQLTPYIGELNKSERALIETAEEPTSYIVQASSDAPPWLCAADGTIGFRLTTHPDTKNLCDILGHPMISTSANLKGRTPVSNPLECHRVFDDMVDHFLFSDYRRTEKPSRIQTLRIGETIRH